MPSQRLSAGILLHRRRQGVLEVLLVHPGGPFWAARDQGAWQIPKGLVDAGEEPRVAALREFAEELGSLPAGTPEALGRIRQAGGKWVEAFALAGDLDPARIVSNRFEIEWPPRSGTRQSFAEVDRAAWFPLDIGRVKMLPSQLPLLDRLVQLTGS
jgi:predicted NUDIX family NTP pyrophosphohydrolase